RPGDGRGPRRPASPPAGDGHRAVALAQRRSRLDARGSRRAGGPGVRGGLRRRRRARARRRRDRTRARRRRSVAPDPRSRRDAAGVGPGRALYARTDLPGRSGAGAPPRPAGLHRSDDWGESWIAIGAGLPEGRASAIAVGRDRSEQIAVTAGARVWTSSDAGGSWELRDRGLSGHEIDVVALDPSDPNRLWLV